MKQIKKRILALILLVAAAIPALATAPVEPTNYPGEGDILNAAFLYDTFHRL